MAGLRFSNAVISSFQAASIAHGRSRRCLLLRGSARGRDADGIGDDGHADDRHADFVSHLTLLLSFGSFTPLAVEQRLPFRRVDAD